MLLANKFYVSSVEVDFFIVGAFLFLFVAASAVAQRISASEVSRENDALRSELLHFDLIQRVSLNLN